VRRALFVLTLLAGCFPPTFGEEAEIGSGKCTGILSGMLSGCCWEDEVFVLRDGQVECAARPLACDNRVGCGDDACVFQLETLCGDQVLASCDDEHLPIDIVCEASP
jgi:hypothetical protein